MSKASNHGNINANIIVWLPAVSRMRIDKQDDPINSKYLLLWEVGRIWACHHMKIT